MRVLFDHQIYSSQQFGGISTYFYEIVSHLPKYVTPILSLIEATNICAQLLGFPKAKEGYKRTIFPNNLLFRTFCKLRYKGVLYTKRGFRLNEEFTKRVIKKGKYDIFHPTYFENYYLDILPSDKPLILTIHDLIPEIFPHLFPSDIQSTNRPALIQRANHIIAVSENTKNDIMRIYHVPENKISVIYHGIGKTPYHPSQKRIVDGEYLLYVGGRFLYKNFDKFCYALKPVLLQHPQIQLVCTGPKFTTEEKTFFEELGIQKRVMHHFCETQQELLDLYHHAICFVYPSAYEGFGIPILEAYKAHCPVMLNNASCFPEIAGDAAIFFDFHKDGTSNFYDQFEKLYNDTNLLQELITRQNLRLKDFSWTKAAQELVHVYKKVLQNN